MATIFFKSYTEAASFAKQRVKEFGYSVRFGRDGERWMVRLPDASRHESDSFIDALMRELSGQLPSQQDLDKQLMNSLRHEEITLERAVELGLSWKPRRNEFSPALQLLLAKRTPDQLNLDKSLTAKLLVGSISMEDAATKGLSWARQTELSEWDNEQDRRDERETDFYREEKARSDAEESEVHEIDYSRGYTF